MLNVNCWLFAFLALLQLRNVAVVAADTSINLCGAFDDWNSTNPAHPYLFIPNAWGDDGTGGSCLNVTGEGAAWTLTYKWTGTASLVKQYAHMKVWPSRLPVRLKDISHLQWKGTWSTVIDGTQNANAAEQAEALHLNAIRSNVAVDMFLSDNPANSTGANPPIEIMIWPWFSPYVKPLGWNEVDPNLYVETVDGMNFSLFHGFNDGGQHVFSWLAHQNMTHTDADYSPLLKYIWQKGLLSGDLFVGQLEFGTEVLHAGATTVFSASDYELKLIRSGDPDDYVTPSSSSLPSATSSTRSTAPPSTVATTTPTTTATSGASSLIQSHTRLAEAILGLMVLTMFLHMQ